MKLEEGGDLGNVPIFPAYACRNWIEFGSFSRSNPLFPIFIRSLHVRGNNQNGILSYSKWVTACSLRFFKGKWLVPNVASFVITFKEISVKHFGCHLLNVTMKLFQSILCWTQCLILVFYGFRIHYMILTFKHFETMYW